MSPEAEVRLRSSLGRRRAEELALVLLADGLTPVVRRAAFGFALEVPADQAERAARVLGEYEREEEARRPADVAGAPDLRAGLLFGAALLLAYVLTGPARPGQPAFVLGSADAARILQGEWWRGVTALTLHADARHVLANAVAGAVFVGAVCGSVGAGVGVALVLSAGGAGNLFNALLRGPEHVSVGASTAVFGAVGVLAGLAVRRRQGQGLRGRRAWVPLGAGLAILAMLGTGGPRVDIWAHLSGLIVGIALGLAVALAPHGRASPPVQWTLAGSTLVALACCWTFAWA